MQYSQTARLRVGLSVATATLALSALAGAAPSYAKTAHAAGRTVHVIEHANTDLEAPLAPGGKDEKADILTFNNPVFNTANTTQVGHDEGFCTRLQVKLGIWECLWTTFLKGGQITVQGPYYDTRNSVLTITGGTGAYDGARGEMKLLARDGGK
jgi:allene oxide cyclase